MDPFGSGSGFDQLAQPTDDLSLQSMVGWTTHHMDTFSSNFTVQPAVSAQPMDSFGELSNFTVQPAVDCSAQPMDSFGSNFTAQPTVGLSLQSMDPFSSNFMVQPMDPYGSGFDQLAQPTVGLSLQSTVGSNFTIQPAVSAQPMDSFGSNFTIQPGCLDGCSAQHMPASSSSYMDMLGDSITQPQVRWI
jgi:hypothetical protein